MFGYYLSLALRSLHRTPILTALMVMAIGVGIGTSMTALAIYRTAAGDPIPARSAELFVPQIDNCGPECARTADFGSGFTSDGLPVMLAYRDATALLRTGPAVRKAAMYASITTLVPPDPKAYPLQVTARATGADFFAMFQVPFEYGAPWNHEDDDAHSPLVVITRALNDRLFGGGNSVGRVLRLNTGDYRIVGVTQSWHPVPRFYDLFPGTLGTDDAAFIPFTRAIDLQLSSNSGITCRSNPPGSGFEQIMASECTWVQFWVELPTAQALARYHQFLEAFAADQRRAGRFQWPPRVQLRDVAEWLRYRGAVPTAIRVAVMVAFSLLAVCLINAMALILARFLPRTPDISVRQAAGATRGAIVLQSLVEVGTIGALGAVVGLLLTAFGLWISHALLPSAQEELIRFDGYDAAITLALSILATLLAGLYPTWRISRIQPASMLKAQ